MIAMRDVNNEKDRACELLMELTWSGLRVVMLERKEFCANFCRAVDSCLMTSCRVKTMLGFEVMSVGSEGNPW